ncbi:uncharacterized protein LOC127862114 [Dreissena polymorpha]|uniref:uncharacterized protein LOC127862114 n=1 Tax=Dreissena polymorpha TaxID=45954 RepID=UPI002265228B|nr:uncharacterized protein LOC127862114 [Dreissena polymorpha]
MATVESADDHSESLTTDEGNSGELLRLAKKLDSKLSIAIQQTLAIVPIHNTLLQGFSELKLVAVGSTQDGSKVNTPFDAGDVDILLTATKKLLSESLFLYVKDHPASLWVLGMNGEHKTYFEDIRSTLIEGQCVPVSALRHIKKEYEETLKVNIKRKFQHGAFTSEARINTIERSKVGYKYESRPTEGTEDKSVEFHKCLSADIVPAFSFEGWPFTAKEWINRKREWPPEDIVKKVTETGCQIVAKQPLDTGTDLARIPDFIERYIKVENQVVNACDKQNVTTLYDRKIDKSMVENSTDKAEGNSDVESAKDGYFRLSFSQCELVLAKSLTKLQVLCWRVLKAYQKAYFDTPPQVLTSYHWKTVVFWVVEETPPTFWKEDNILEAVFKMLDKMINFLKNGFIPLYFVRNQNLITATSENAIKQALVQVNHIRKRPIESLQWFLDNPPKPDSPEVSVQPARADSKPFTLLDFFDEHFNDSNADLFSSYEKDVIELMRDVLSQANNRGPMQTEENTQVTKSAENTSTSHNSTTETGGDSMDINVKQLFQKNLRGLTDSSKQNDTSNANQGRYAKPGSEMSNLESVLEKALGALVGLMKHNPNNQASASSESPSPSRELGYLSFLIVVFLIAKCMCGKEADPEFGRALVGLKKHNPNNQASASSDLPSPIDFGSLMANMKKFIDEIPNLQTTDKKNDETSKGSDCETAMAGESSMMMSGGERSKADLESGQNLVELMNQNQNIQASASSDTPTPFRMEKSIKDMIDLPPTDKQNDETSKGSLCEIELD